MPRLNSTPPSACYLNITPPSHLPQIPRTSYLPTHQPPFFITFNPTIMSSSTWESIRARKQAERESRIPSAWRLPSHLIPSDSDESALNVTDTPRTCGLLSRKELDITEKYDATALAAELNAGRLKCVEVTEAFCKVRIGAKSHTRSIASHVEYSSKLTGCMGDRERP